MENIYNKFYRRTAKHVSLGVVFITVIFCSIFTLIGIFALISGIIECKDSKKYNSITAKCEDTIFKDGLYYPVYLYNVNGVDYITTSEKGWKDSETIGSETTIYYLISDPNEIYIKKPATIENGAFIIFGGVLFISFGLGFSCSVIVSHIKTKNNLNNNAKVEDGVILKEEVKNLASNCPYCGRDKNTSDSCPDCGASRLN